GYAYDRLGRMREVTDAAGERHFLYDPATLAQETEVFVSGIFAGAPGTSDDLAIQQNYEDGTGGTVKGRWNGLRIGNSGDSYGQYAAGYAYDAYGRLSRVNGPGLHTGTAATSGAHYVYDGTDSDMVRKIQYKENGTLKAEMVRDYETKRDLL